MSISVGSSSDALSYIQSLLQSVGNVAGNAAGVGPVGDWLASAVDSAKQGASGATAAPQAFGMAPPPFQDGTMAALIALKGQDAGGSVQSLFSKLDTDGDGKISQSELETALGSSGVDASRADALFTKLDRDGDGGIGQGELTSALRRGHGRHHHHHMDAIAGGGNGLSSLLDATGAKTQTASNADGSSTTTITYADGSTVTMTTPAAQASGSSSDSASTTQTAANTTPINLIEQLIKMQAQLVARQGATVSAVA
jgi:hypothetical protein